MLKLKKFALTISLLLVLPLAAFGMEERTDGDTGYSKVVLLASHDSNHASIDGDKIRRPPFRPGFIPRSYPYGFYPYGFYPYGFYPYGFGFYPYYLLDNGGEEEAQTEGENWEGNQ